MSDKSPETVEIYQENLPYTPGNNSANCDPDFDAMDDDTREIATGLRDMARMEGEAAHG